MIVVSDTSALYALSTLNKLDLLPALYGPVMIPPVVLQKWTSLMAEAKLLQKPVPWLRVVSPADNEAVAIVPALESEADFLLMDERRGRAAASSLGLKLRGTLAVLLEGKAAGLVDAVVPLMDRLISEINFRISKSLYLQIAIEANEQ